MQSPDDIVMVHNIDIDCEYKSSWRETKIHTFKDPETGNPYREAGEILTDFDHTKGFTTIYGGRKFTVAPGETKSFPRYIAEKFCEELVDHLLMKKDKKGDIGLLTNDMERSKLRERIIIEELGMDDESDVKVLRPITNEPIVQKKQEEILEPEAGEEIVKIGEKTFSRQQLMKDCKELGIKFTLKDTTQDLLKKIKEFSGV